MYIHVCTPVDQDTTLPVGVEKNNADAKRNYFSSSRWDAPREIILAEARLERLAKYNREKRTYIKQNEAYWRRKWRRVSSSQMK